VQYTNAQISLIISTIGVENMVPQPLTAVCN
jgi:hypothetical protein